MNRFAALFAIFCLTQNLTCAQSSLKPISPEDCMARIQQAQLNQDDQALLSCMTEATRCQTVGQVAYEIGRLTLFRTPQAAEAAKLLEKHGASGIDIMGQMQLLSMTNKDPTLAWVQGGAWVEEPAAFLTAGKKMLEAANKDLSEQAGQASVAEKEPAAKTAAAAPTLSEITIDGDFAEGQLQQGDGQKVPVAFRRVGGGWYLAQSRSEPIVHYPSKMERKLAQFAGRGSLEFDSSAEGDTKPTAFHYRGDDSSRSPITDADLALLANFSSLRQISIEDAAKVTDVGVAALGNVKKLVKVKLANLALTSASIQRLSALPALEILELENIDASDEVLATFRKAHPRCTLSEKYYLRGIHYEVGQTLTDIRNKDRVTLVAVFGETSPIPVSSIAPPVSGMKELVHEIKQNYTQVIIDPPWHAKDKPEWWQKRPYLEAHVLPQFAIFPKGDKKPVLLTGNVSVSDLAKAIKAVQAP